MSGIDEQDRSEREFNIAEKKIERMAAHRMNRTLRYQMMMYSPSPLGGLLTNKSQQLSILPDEDELVKYYRNVKLNRELQVYE